MAKLSLNGGKRNLEYGKDFFPGIFGVLNLTEDSFSDGGRYVDAGAAFQAASEMIRAGADVIDIGAESTKPGNEAADPGLEISRMVPLIRRIRESYPGSVISIDTRKSIVADECLKAGADIINDVSGLAYDPSMADVVALHGAGLVIMHMRGTPADMQSPENLKYGDVVSEVRSFLLSAMEKALKAGVRKDSMILDPGIGFSKDFERNIELVAGLKRLSSELDYPFLYGISRKTFIGQITGMKTPSGRDYGTLGGIGCLALMKCAFVRVHNVQATVDFLKVFSLIMKKTSESTVGIQS